MSFLDFIDVVPSTSTGASAGAVDVVVVVEVDGLVDAVVTGPVVVVPCAVVESSEQPTRHRVVTVAIATTPVPSLRTAPAAPTTDRLPCHR
jgi:hypothetical protein